MNFDLTPLIISIKTSLIATIITSIIGILIAYLMMNYKGKFRTLIEIILTLPLILPPTVVGFCLLLIFGKNGIIGNILISMNKNIIFTWWATVISAVAVSLPIMYRSLRSSFEQIDENIILSARTLGLSEWNIFKKIILPLSTPGVIGGIALSFARAIGEFGATLMIAGNIPGKTQTIPIAIFFEVESGNMAMASFWVMVIILMSLGIMLILNYWSNKQLKIVGKRK
ncbi:MULTISPECIES: molybdate ABC transporter permease subunit [Romboutsia]|uniref:Molybdenum transport system permease n=1 Tax=Romboutsia hominis TaxID=1507512 RepID=A0A2P2BND8_9FIRM|nr:MULTISPECIES: molybdate ABC transporter permease subunit [Romboutsia]MCH1959435.1 molybdate ABC transporter permease subunit [Romboutsia hominis]MCH1970334.1 molybdate ABC transporter permease subunit [Romboutsia hominis]MDB8806183.1 molybdate ABC transporter permease subunit [Romboutsia sp. 1001216sp1]MDB8808785.1 molybdate ABC transporter permease subunit [Romboutsia sp. 1001216sp1]MDB8811860.1 molybdate ABC transporter permease subunit [Romboutsia sp. 1001216sp1]